MGKRGRRRRFVAADKVSILKRHLVGKEEVSKICEELRLHPNQFYEWQKQFFENGVKAFESEEKREEAKLQAENSALKARLQRKDEILAELMDDHLALKKKSWGGLTERWVEPDLRDRVVDFIAHWKEREFNKVKLIRGLGLCPSKFYSWQERYGKENEHNAKIPRDHWLEEWEKEKILDYYLNHQQDGYRRVSYMMLDANIVAVSAATTYRVLSEAGLLRRWNRKKSTKGNGFTPPLKPHEHWHIDISYLNICGTFYYFIGILDGYSRYIVHWDIRTSMTEGDVALVIERAKEKFPGVTPRIISDNGPQFIAKDFKEYIRLSGMTHVKTSPYYPQSNGKLERFNRTMKSECIRPKTPVSLEDALRLVSEFVRYYNNTRLHSAIGYITPADKLLGKELEIFKGRDLKLEAARAKRKLARKKTIDAAPFTVITTLRSGETETGSAGMQPC